MEIKEIEVKEKGITDISKNLEIKEKGITIHLINRIKNIGLRAQSPYFLLLSLCPMLCTNILVSGYNSRILIFLNQTGYP
jgi:hypothetical protein